MTEYYDAKPGIKVTHRSEDGEGMSWLEHGLDSTCWCQPKKVHEDSDSGNQVWEHYRNVGKDGVM